MKESVDFLKSLYVLHVLNLKDNLSVFEFKVNISSKDTHGHI